MGRLKEALLYPSEPGSKGGGTSREAAKAVSGSSEEMRRRVMAQLPGTAEEIAERLGLSRQYVAPRLSELVAEGKAYKSPRRKRNESTGLTASVYERKEP